MNMTAFALQQLLSQYMSWNFTFSILKLPGPVKRRQGCVYREPPSLFPCCVIFNTFFHRELECGSMPEAQGEWVALLRS